MMSHLDLIQALEKTCHTFIILLFKSVSLGTDYLAQVYLPVTKALLDKYHKVFCTKYNKLGPGSVLVI